MMNSHLGLFIVLSCLATAVVAQVGQDLLFVGDRNAPGILWADLPDPRNDTNILDTEFNLITLSAGTEPRDIEYDPSESRIYWCDFNRDEISRIQLDGTNQEQIISANSVYNIALDPLKRKIYWTSQNQQTISRANMDGTDVERLFRYIPTTFVQPNAILVDPLNEYILWSARQQSNHIQQANLDGTNSHVVRDFGTSGFSARAMVKEQCTDDYARLFYVTDQFFRTLRVMNIDGSDDELIADFPGVPGGFSNTLYKYGGKLFWSNGTTKRSIFEYDLSTWTLKVHNLSVSLAGSSDTVDIDPMSIGIFTDETYDDPIAIEDCPDSFTINLDEGSTSATVSWPKPKINPWASCPSLVFNGDVGNGDTASAGVFDITYTATDSAGNSDICHFTVTVTASGICDDTGDETKTCQNDALCVDDIHGNYCDCSPGYAGNLCEDKLTSVECRSSGMTVTIDRRLVPETTDKVHFQDVSCEGVPSSSNDVITLSTGYGECSTTSEEDETTITFTNIITYDTSPDADSEGIITHTYHMQVEVQCSLNKAQILSGSFKPEIGKVAFTSQGTGEFDITLNRYTDDSLSTQITDVHSVVWLSERLFFGVFLQSVSDFGLYIDGCWATRNPDPVDSAGSRHIIILSGCPTDPTAMMPSTGNPTLWNEQAFSFEAFAFIGASGESHVYLHCNVVVCSNDEVATNRNKDCTSGLDVGLLGRKRRSANSGHTVSYGPMVFGKRTSDTAARVTTDSSSYNPLGMLLIGALAAVIAMATMFGIVRVVRKSMGTITYAKLPKEPMGGI